MSEVSQQQEKLGKAAELAFQDTHEKIATLRKLLDDKEKELEEGVKRMESSKKHTIEFEVTRAKEKMAKIDESIELVSDAMGSKSPLEFLLKTEEVEEKIRHAALAADPEVKQRWFDIPSLYIDMAEQTIKGLQHYDKEKSPGLYPQTSILLIMTKRMMINETLKKHFI